MVKPLNTTLASQPTFEMFLQEKVKSGFTVRDYLEAKYFKFSTANTLRDKIKNFLLLGGAGYFFTPSKVDHAKWDLFKTKATFYLAYQETLALYQKCERNPQQFYAKTMISFEKLHQIGQEIPFLHNRHVLINQTLRRGSSSFTQDPIEKSLIVYSIQDKLTEGGRVTLDRMLTFFQSYQALRKGWEKKGYGFSGEIPAQGVKVSEEIPVKEVISKMYHYLLESHPENRRVYRLFIEHLKLKEFFGSESEEERIGKLQERAKLLSKLTQDYLDHHSHHSNDWRRFVGKPLKKP
ncbi:hypothetical protein [Rhabdochlamydiaceae symbiont of Dictyostelium giganteum]|uniref:hypothetical protein n=1 Tax=Rhabdochlamydiaceae symbiont of Dictyostelium giganteum TaxID=3342349 RepID=UPI003850812F